MNRIGRKWSVGLGACLALVLAVAAQNGWAQPAPASVHGHVNNAIGSPLTKGQVKLTQDRSAEEKNRKYTYTFDLNASGDFKGTGIAPGNYLAIVFVDDKSV